MGTTCRFVAWSSVVTRSMSVLSMADPSASSTALFCFPTYTFFPNARAASKNTLSFPMVYVPKRNNTLGLNDSALTESLTAAKTSHCGGNT